MLDNPIEPIVIGKIGAPYGVKGWVKLQSFLDPKDNILDYANWYINRQGTWQAFEVKEIRPHGDGFVALLQGLNDRDEAAKLTNSSVAVARQMLPELEDSEQHYWVDLIGLEVVTESGEILGTIDSLLETGANDVLVVKGQTEHLIPYVPDEYVIHVDLDANLMTVNWDPEF